MCLASYIRTLSGGHGHLPPGPRLPKKLRNTHPRNYYDLKGKGIDVHIFIFQVEELILWIELPWPENPPNTYARHTGTLDCCFDLIRSHQQCIHYCYCLTNTLGIRSFMPFTRVFVWKWTQLQDWNLNSVTTTLQSSALATTPREFPFTQGRVTSLWQIWIRILSKVHGSAW